jgi:hypothetical protein
VHGSWEGGWWDVLVLYRNLTSYKAVCYGLSDLEAQY